jgi:large conductance mechanosensitive channel
MVKEFIGFLKQYGVVGLAIAVIIGGKLNDLVKTVVDGVLMPIIMMAVPDGDWRKWEVHLGSAKLLLGPVIGASIDFVIVAAVVFAIAKFLFKEKEVAKR